MLYHYLAQDPKGRFKEGTIDKPNLQTALNALADKHLKPLTIKSVILSKKKGFSIFKGKITIQDKIFLTRYLSLMLKVGTGLLQAIDVLLKDFDSGPVRRFLFEVRANLQNGKPFWYTFSQHPEYFSLVTVNLLKAGESSGNLEATLSRISENLERERDLRGQIKSSLIYPIILLIASYFMAIFLTTFVVPKLAQVFMSTGQKIPTFSRIVLEIGLFVNRYVYIIVPLSIIIPLGLYFYFDKTKKGRIHLENLMNKIPVIRNLLDKIALERFTTVLSNLLKAGMPIVKAVKITAQTIGSPKFKEALDRIADKDLSEGLGIGGSFRQEKVFPAIVSNLLAIGEKTGHTENILNTLSGFYEKEIRSSLKILVSFLEPALLVLIGIIIGSIALAFFVPVYQLVGQF